MNALVVGSWAWMTGARVFAARDGVRVAGRRTGAAVSRSREKPGALLFTKTLAETIAEDRARLSPLSRSATPTIRCCHATCLETGSRTSSAHPVARADGSPTQASRARTPPHRRHRLLDAPPPPFLAALGQLAGLAISSASTSRSRDGFSPSRSIFADGRGRLRSGPSGSTLRRLPYRVRRPVCVLADDRARALARRRYCSHADAARDTELPRFTHHDGSSTRGTARHRAPRRWSAAGPDGLDERATRKKCFSIPGLRRRSPALPDRDAAVADAFVDAATRADPALPARTEVEVRRLWRAIPVALRTQSRVEIA